MAYYDYVLKAVMIISAVAGSVLNNSYLLALGGGIALGYILEDLK